MHILQDKRKRGLAAIFAFGGLAHGAGRRIEKKSAIVRFAVVVAGGAKPERAGEHQQSGRKRPPVMLRIDQRRIKGRKVRAPAVKSTFESAQRGVQTKTSEHNNYR